jgi:hypothetical protein
MKNLLSHHEMATLFVLYNSPERVALAAPDALAPQQAHLVEVVSTKSDDAQFRLTSKRTELLRRFGLARSKRRSSQAAAGVNVEGTVKGCGYDRLGGAHLLVSARD